MPVFLIGLMLVSAASFLIGLGGRLRRLARGGNIGINQLVLNEGRTIRAASADARPTVKAPITRDRDETGDYLIIHDVSPSTSSLVEREAER